MKKWLLLLFCCFLFSGCGSDDALTDAPVFSLTAKQQETYETIIQETLNSFYWYYQADSLQYASGQVPKETEETAALFEASAQSGYDLSRYAGRDAVVYTVNLQQFNHADGGLCTFYFVGNTLAGVYHGASDDPAAFYPLSIRNPFAKGTSFLAYESDAPLLTYEKGSSRQMPDGFCATYVDDRQYHWYLSVNGSQLMLYRFQNGYFSLQRTINVLSQTGLMPLSAAFTADGGLAVIVGTEMENANDSGQVRHISEKAVFYDAAFHLTGEEIPFTSGSYSCAALVDGQTAFLNENTMETYTYTQEGWQRQAVYTLGVGATTFLQTDLDEDGQAEYVLSDGLDLYVFHKENQSFQCIWRTNVGVESFSGYLYAGDTNGDGVKEIYASDATGTAIRYVVTKNGLVSRNEDINYQQQLFVDDFDGDGVADYILKEGAEAPVKTLYLGENTP